MVSFWIVLRSTFLDGLKFSGRSSRSSYWIWQLEVCAVLLLLDFVYMDLVGIFVVVITLPTVALSWRRAHDSGNPGWPMLIPFVREIIALFPSKDGINQYGPPPPPLLSDFDYPNI